MATIPTSIAFLHPIVAEVVADDAEVNLTHCMAMKSPGYFSEGRMRVYEFMRKAPTREERTESIAYFFRNELFNLQ